VSIRLRLTLWYSAILALTLIAFSGLLYTTQSQYTLNMVQNDLAMNADRIVGMLQVRPDRNPDRTVTQPWPFRQGDAESDRLLQPPDFRDLRARDTIRLLAADGTPLDITLNEQSEDLAPSPQGLQVLQDGHVWQEIVRGDEGRLLVYNQPVRMGATTIGIVQVARSLADRDRSLQALGMTLLLGSLVTTVVAFGVGWVLAGVTLRPIHRITQTAREIGQTRDFSSRVPHRGPNDELGQLATTFNGMLDRLAGAYQQVTHALQMQRDFVADVSHELRTPLTTIRGNLALMRRDPPVPREEQEDILNDLIGESERLIRLVSDLLILARADAGRQLECQPVAVKPLVDEAVRQARLLGPGQEVECAECAGPQDPTALADPDALKQVLLILLDNAVKHADGPIHVAVDNCDDRVAISVQDSGPGMPAELCARIFDRFYRGDESRSRPGFGLGLSIAKALVEAQRGDIAVRSEIGRGSCFTVTLPRTVPSSA
jgi:two-component system OmpR family sensor kinase